MIWVVRLIKKIRFVTFCMTDSNKMIILFLRKFVVKENIFKLLRFISFASYMACLVTFQCDLIIVLKRY